MQMLADRSSFTVLRFQECTFGDQDLGVQHVVSVKMFATIRVAGVTDQRYLDGLRNLFAAVLKFQQFFLQIPLL